MECSTTGFPVLHHLLELAQTHTHWVSDAIQPSCSLSSLFPPAFHLSQHQGSFLMSWLFESCGGSMGASASASTLPMNIQDWFPLWLTVLISLMSKGLSRFFSNTKFKSINSSVLSLLYGPILIPIGDYWKNHNFDYTEICWLNNVSAFSYAI